MKLAPESPALAAYLNRYYKAMPGFSSRFSAKIMTGLLRWQAANGVAGNVGEVGVFLGRSMIALALAAADGDRILAVDTYTWPEDAEQRFRASAERFGVDARTLNIIAGDSRTMTSQQLLDAGGGRPSRLFHIDGDHAADSLRKDLALCAGAMADAGILSIDDMLHPMYPQLTRVVDDFTGVDSEWRVFCIIDREDFVGAAKYLLCRRKYMEMYIGAATALFPEFVFKISADFQSAPALVLTMDAPLVDYYDRLNSA